MDIEELRRKQDEHQIAVYEEYESALREKYVSLSPEERIDFLRGLEFLIAEDNQSVALLNIRKHAKKGASKSKKDADVYLSGITDENTREKVRYMLERGVDKSRVQTILAKIPRTQDEIAAQVGIPAGTLRSSLHYIRRNGELSMSGSSAKIAEYLVEQGYKPKK